MVDYEVSPIRKETQEQHDASLVEEMRRSGKALQAIYPDGNTRAIKSITAEGDRVVAEYMVHAGRTIFQNDTEHNFHCVKVFEFQGDKVVSLREYCDSAYLAAFGQEIAEFMHQTEREGIDQDAADRSSWGSSWLLKTPKMELNGANGAPELDATLEENKRIARTAVENWGLEPMLDLLAEDVMFTNEVDLANTPTLGKALRGKAEIAAACRRVFEIFPEGLNRNITAITAEENRVVVEEVISGRSIVRPDLEFHLFAMKIFFIRNGKVFRIRQHLDSGYCEAYSHEAIRYVFGESTELPVPSGTGP